MADFRLERRPSMLRLRLAMLTAWAELQSRIDVHHINAAMAWIRHATASVQFIFVSATEQAKLAQVLELSDRVLAFLRERGQATRSQISADCFKGKVTKAQIDASLERLLAATPPKILVRWIERPADAPGTPTRRVPARIVARKLISLIAPCTFASSPIVPPLLTLNTPSDQIACGGYISHPRAKQMVATFTPHAITPGYFLALLGFLHHRETLCRRHLFDFAAHHHWLAARSHLGRLCPEPVQNRQEN